MSSLDLHTLPKFRDGWSYLYVEHCRIDREDKAISVHDAQGRVVVPCASLALLMLGPGVSITHAAVLTLVDCGCLVAWCGEQGVRFYAVGMGETRQAGNLLHQARTWADAASHMRVVMKLYRMRFREAPVGEGLSLAQLRGMEGIRVRESYARASRETGVEWKGRSYKRDSWRSADPVNRALSTANSCLYGICHAGIVSAGFSPAIGFIHTGKMLSFVYDIADLYKTEVTIPTAFREAAGGMQGLEGRVRRACRDAIRESRMLERIVPDVQRALDVPAAGAEVASDASGGFDVDAAAPGGLWDPQGDVDGGVNFGGEDDGDDSGASDAGAPG